MAFYTEPPTTAHVKEWQVGKSVVQTNGCLLENQIRCDVTFVVKGDVNSTARQIGGHKLILISRSPVFETMFSDRWATESHEVQINDSEFNDFQEFLRFLYTESCMVNAGNALSLIYLGKKYMHSKLVEVCTKFIEENLTPDNVCSLFQSCARYKDDELAERCKKFVVENARKVFLTEGYFGLSQEYLLRVISSDVLVDIDEAKVFNCCLRWAENQCNVKKIRTSPDNLRAVLGDILYQIRLPTMTAETMAATIGNSGVITSAEKGEIYTYILTKKRDPSLKYACKPRGYTSQTSKKCQRGRQAMSNFASQLGTPGSANNAFWAKANRCHYGDQYN